MSAHLQTHVNDFKCKFKIGFSLAFYQPIPYELEVENMDVPAHLFSKRLSQGFLCLLFMCVNKWNVVLACLKPVILLHNWHLVMCLGKVYRLTPTPTKQKETPKPKIWERQATCGKICYNILKPEYIYEQFSFGTWQLLHNGILMCQHAFRSQHIKNDLEGSSVKPYWSNFGVSRFNYFFPSAAL